MNVPHLRAAPSTHIDDLVYAKLEGEMRDEDETAE